MNSEQTPPHDDPTAVSRKKDHIELAFRSQVERLALDSRFFYEPALAAHPKPGSLPPISFLGKTLRTPVWVSSMTGGTALARTINRNLAQACAEFGMGMGLGSCRQLLYSDEYLPDFDVRDIIGPELPLYANLGIAQVENLLRNQQAPVIRDLLNRLRADGQGDDHRDHQGAGHHTDDQHPATRRGSAACLPRDGRVGREHHGTRRQ